MAKHLDQCEYPDRQGEPGDCCTNSASRRRKTRHGWLWLCGEHFGRPVAELFDDRERLDTTEKPAPISDEEPICLELFPVVNQMHAALTKAHRALSGDGKKREALQAIDAALDALKQATA
jgi:hypothetical protein